MEAFSEEFLNIYTEMYYNIVTVFIHFIFMALLATK